MTTEKDTIETWNIYGSHQLARGLELPELDRWDWGIPNTGPGIEVLGDVAGMRVLDLGSGLGRHAARLASLGAEVTAVDASAAQHQRALARYPDTPGLHLVCADAVAHLQDAAPYDLIYSVGGLPYLDPGRLLPALANGLKPGGRLVFSALHTNSHGVGPSTEVAPRPEILRLPGTTEDHSVAMWVLAPQLWEDLLVQHGLAVETITAVDAPQQDQALSYRLYVARRPERVPSRPRTAAPPPPNAALGVGVIVHGPDGVLLGRHRRGTWELPGGTVEPGETLAEAAVRELAEESGLVAAPDGVQLLGTLLDHVGDVVRMTVPVLVTSWSGTPQRQEETIGSWRFWALDALPQPLFVTSSQCLTAWNPALRLDHPAATFQPYGGDLWETIGRLADLFTGLDTARGLPQEQQWTLQALKLAEEAGETAQAVIGALGTNPRKGQSHTWQHVQGEMVDTAITSMVGLYRMLGNEAPAFLDAMLGQKAAKFLLDDRVATVQSVEGA
ncbi:NUDIX domain-containing protein [Streptomyces sp. NPDC093984]|uniref:NUDIX domain-containing protein n=1 Tax=Streptomyces sp. NPDC093984 TaxID=3366052 RepID=UPI0038202002